MIFNKNGDPSPSIKYGEQGIISEGTDMKSLRRKNLTPEELASIVGPLAQACNVSSVHLFGSRATGDYRRDSDYDFLITVNKNYGYHDYCRFADGLEEALGGPVDIVNESCLKDDNFARRVRREAVRVC